MAAAIGAVMVGSATVAAAQADPGSALWPITQMVWPARAESIQSTRDAEVALAEARSALATGRSADARQAILRAETELAGIADTAARDSVRATATRLWTQSQLGPGGRTTPDGTKSARSSSAPAGRGSATGSSTAVPAPFLDTRAALALDSAGSSADRAAGAPAARSSSGGSGSGSGSGSGAVLPLLALDPAPAGPSAGSTLASAVAATTLPVGDVPGADDRTTAGTTEAPPPATVPDPAVVLDPAGDTAATSSAPVAAQQSPPTPPPTTTTGGTGKDGQEPVELPDGDSDGGSDGGADSESDTGVPHGGGSAATVTIVVTTPTIEANLTG